MSNDKTHYREHIIPVEYKFNLSFFKNTCEDDKLRALNKILQDHSHVGWCVINIPQYTNNYLLTVIIKPVIDSPIIKEALEEGFFKNFFKPKGVSHHTK